MYGFLLASVIGKGAVDTQDVGHYKSFSRMTASMSRTPFTMIRDPVTSIKGLFRSVAGCGTLPHHHVHADPLVYPTMDGGHSEIHPIDRVMR